MAEINSKKKPIKCPALKCGEALQDHELQTILDPDQIMRDHDFPLNIVPDDHSKQASKCPNSRCSNNFVIERGVDKFRCSVCNITFCMNCRVKFHKGQSCDEYQAKKNDAEAVRSLGN
jgi:hypothetical protein